MARLAAGTRKRAGGTLEKRITINGKRISIYGKNTAEIEEKEKVTREKYKNGNYINNENITLDKYFDEWIENKRGTIKSNTLKTHIAHYKHISKHLGKRKIVLIERREVIKLQSDLTKVCSTAYTNQILTTLKTILYDAVKDDIITKNPCTSVKGLKQKKNATETYHRALTEDEQKIFMQELKNDYYYDFIALLLASGMRCGEVSALTWQDIDFKNNLIHVSKTLTYSEDGKALIGDTTKTSAGKRDIPITGTIKSILDNARNKGNIIPFKTNQIFTTPYNKIVVNATINKAIRDALARLDNKSIYIEHFTAHALRDTFATRYIEQGGNMQTLKTILGHSSLSMTMDLYAHVLPNTKQEEMQRINIII